MNGTFHYRRTLKQSRSTCWFSAVLTIALLSGSFPTLASLSLIETPESVGMSSTQLARMDAVIKEEISQHHLPGAVVLVGRKGHVVWRKAYGSRALEPAREAMTSNTIFDLASLTKVVATATS